ncbi:MAG: polysaccharide biosynthesis/export family protein [Gemmatimonadota bacterium]|nr:polysaccharide biosynthesis/export family protein [Gemmatimonadota bacterium]MDP6803233.1 polysaccharide biosynthesis/export family protein [Gemmatimonadota bacterium]
MAREMEATAGICERAGRQVRKLQTVLLLIALFAGLGLCSQGCGSAYYREGEDEFGDLPDSLRILVETRESVERRASREAEGVTVREVGAVAAKGLPLEFASEGAYLLRRGDQIQVEVLFYPEMRTLSWVRPDGMVTAPGIGDVEALGRRPEEVAADIEAYYSTLLRDPTTTVNVVDFGERKAYVFGEVLKPGAVPLEQRMTLTQALASVGSVSHDAKLSSVVLLRRKTSHSAQAYRLDLHGVLDGQSLAADLILQPDDVVYVPRKFVAKMEQFVEQVFGGLFPIPDTFIKGYDAIHVDERSALRRNITVDGGQ